MEGAQDVPAVSQSISAQTTKSVTSSASHPNILDHFYFFAKLPIELRLLIWELSIPTPRRVNLSLKKPRVVPYFQEVRCRDDPLPAIFSVNHESRSLALKLHIDICPPYRALRSTHTKQQSRYINLQRDYGIVYLSDVWFSKARYSYSMPWRANRLEAAEGLRRLVITAKTSDWLGVISAPRVISRRMDKFLKWFNALEEVVLEVQAGGESINFARTTAHVLEGRTDIVLGSFVKKPNVKVAAADS